MAISISIEWIWNYLKGFHYVLSLPLLKQYVIPRVIEFCYHYLDEPMNEIPYSKHNGCCLMIHSLVQPWYASFLSQLNKTPELRGELLIAARILNIEPLEDLIGTTLPFPQRKHSLCDLRAILVENYSTSSSHKRQKRRMDSHCNGSRKR